MTSNSLIKEGIQVIASFCFLIFGAMSILLSITGRVSISDYRETGKGSWLAADEVGGSFLHFPYIESPDGREKVAKYLSRTYFKLGSIYLFLGVILIFLPEFSMELIWFSVIVCAVLASFGFLVSRSLIVDKALETKREYALMSEAKKTYQTIVCPSCKKEISTEYRQCPWCGAQRV